MSIDNTRFLTNRKNRHKPMVIGNNKLSDHVSHEPSAVLQIDDTNGGFLTSRLTVAQRDAIDGPAKSLLIWNIDDEQFEYWDGTKWVPLGGAGTVIPTLDVSIASNAYDVASLVKLKLTQSAAHLEDLNPKIILMRYRAGRRGQSGFGGAKNNKRWVHPTHMNGSGYVGSNINGGEHRDFSGNLLPPRPTEWDLTTLEPFLNTHLTVDFREWFSTNTTQYGGYFTGTGDKNGIGVNLFSQPFAFSLEIDNPDPSKITKNPRVRGPISIPFIVQRQAAGNIIIKFASGPGR